MMTKVGRDYIGVGSTFEPFDHQGGSVPLCILPFLYGTPWCDLALGFIHLVNPTSIRVTTGEITCDFMHGRVTVFVTEEGIIRSIEQECDHLGLPEGFGEDIHQTMNEIIMRYNRKVAPHDY